MRGRGLVGVVPAVFVLLWSSPGHAWSMLSTHEDIAELALQCLNRALAYTIAERAGEPDWCHIFGRIPSPVLCTYAHQVSTLRGGDVSGVKGAEEGVVFWAAEARAAYQNGDEAWISYLAWAIHFLTDALCPVHCLTAAEHTLPAHLRYEGRFANLRGEYRRALSGLECDLFLENGERVTTLEALGQWTLEKAGWVRAMATAKILGPRGSLIPYDDVHAMVPVFAEIGKGIRWLLAYVTATEPDGWTGCSGGTTCGEGMRKGAGVGSTFIERPPIIGAHTLSSGEWRISVGTAVSLAPTNNWAGSVTVEYGLTRCLQGGLAVTYGLQEEGASYDFSLKFRLPLGSRLDLGVPFVVSFLDADEGIHFIGLRGGGVVTLRLRDGLSLHGGATLGLAHAFYIQPYIIADFDILPNVKLVGEAGLIPLSVAVGAWIRVLESLDVKLALVPVPLSLSVGVYLRL